MGIKAVGLHGPFKSVAVYYPVRAVWEQLGHLYLYSWFFLCHCVGQIHFYLVE
jgi:hypothetical protein